MIHNNSFEAVPVTRIFLENGDLITRIHWRKYKVGMSPPPKFFKDQKKIDKKNIDLIPDIKAALDGLKIEDNDQKVKLADIPIIKKALEDMDAKKVKACIELASSVTNSVAYEMCQTFGISPIVAVLMQQGLNWLINRYRERNYQPTHGGENRS